MKAPLLLFVAVFAFHNSVISQGISVERRDLTTGWAKTLSNGQTVGFPTSISSLNFTINNNSTSDLTISPQMSGDNHTNFIVFPTSIFIAENTSTDFTITYDPVGTFYDPNDDLVSNATLRLIDDASSANLFEINLVGSGWFYGPDYPPPFSLPTFELIKEGSIEFPDGVSYSFQNVGLAGSHITYWGPAMDATGLLDLRISFNDASSGDEYVGDEHFTFAPDSSELQNGKAVWMATTTIPTTSGAPTVYLKCILTTKTLSGNVIPMIPPTELGLSEELGGLVEIQSTNPPLKANYVILCSSELDGSYLPYIEFYFNFPGKTCSPDCAHASVGSGFYWKDIAPELTNNFPLTLLEAETKAINSPINLDVDDNEDLGGPILHPELIVFHFFQTGPGNPMDYNTGQLEMNGNVLTNDSTFTLLDLQNNAIEFVHDGSQPIILPNGHVDQFEFNVSDSKGILASDGVTTFSFFVNVNPVNDPPIAYPQTYTISYLALPTILDIDPVAYDEEMTNVTYFKTTDPSSFGTVNWIGVGSSFEFTQTTNTIGISTFLYEAHDFDGLSSTPELITIHLVDLPPIASDDTVSVMEGGSIDIMLEAFDPENMILTYNITDGPHHASSFSGLGNLYTYTPAVDYFGGDFVKFTATDPSFGVSEEKTVKINIIPRLDPGDIIAADKNILRLYDPVTEQDTIIAKDSLLTNAVNLAYQSGSSLFVFDNDTGLINIDPTTGHQSLIKERSFFSDMGPLGILFNNNGDVILPDANNIVSVNTFNSDTDILFTDNLLAFPTGVVYLNNGDLIVTDARYYINNNETSRIIRITPTGFQSEITSADNILLPVDLALFDEQTIVVTDIGGLVGGSDKIYKIDLSSGIQTLLSSEDKLSHPSGLDYDYHNSSATLYAVNANFGDLNPNTGKILDINTIGTQTILPGTTLANPWGLLVVPTCTNPAFTICPGDLEINITGATACDTIVQYTSTAAGVPLPDITYSFAGATTGSGTGSGSDSTFNVGTTTVTLTASNTCYTATCSFEVKVTENVAPVITCPADTIIYANAAGCIYNEAIGTPLALDLCTGVYVTAPVGPYPIGDTIVIWAATDTSGNTATCPQNVTILSSAIPSIVPGGPTTFCIGDSVTLDAGPGFTSYDWSTNETSNSISVNTTGLYTVNVTDINNCTGFDTTTVTVNPIPSFTASSYDTTICSDDPLSINLDGLVGTNGSFTSFEWQVVSNINTVMGAFDGSDLSTFSVGLSIANYQQGSVSYTITPTYTYNGVPCVGPAVTLTVHVNGLPDSSKFVKPNNQNYIDICSDYWGLYFSVVEDPLVKYSWDASVDSIPFIIGSDTNNSHHNCVMFFHDPPLAGNGIVDVFVRANVKTTGCYRPDVFTVQLTSPATIDTAHIVLSDATNGILACLNNDVDEYQWGFYDKATLNDAFAPPSPEIYQVYIAGDTEALDLAHNYWWVITGKDNCESKSFYNLSDSDWHLTGISNSPAAIKVTDVLLYPNPNDGTFMLRINGFSTMDVTLSIADLTGRMYLTEKVSSDELEAGMPLQVRLDQGIYLIRAMDKMGKSVVTKFVIQ